MSIEKFHSSIQSKGEGGALFAALRLLNVADPLRVRQADDSEPYDGWDPWAAAQ